MRFPVPGWMWDRALGEQLYADHMRFIRRIDELGIDGVIFTEHHYTPNGGLTPSPLVLLSAATQITERIKLVTLGIPLALYPHPVRVAEELALLDNLSHGRLVVGLISGSPPNLFAYNVPAAEERSRYHEAYDLIVKAWTDEHPFEWHGQRYDYECVSILPRPVQNPHPPVWTVATSDESLRWAAQHQMGLIASGSTDTAAARLNYYRQYAQAECDWSPSGAQRGLAREFYIAATQQELDAKAQEIFNPEGERAYDAVHDAPQLEELRREAAAVRTYSFRGHGEEPGLVRRGPAAIESGEFLIGDPETIARQITHQHAACDAEVLVIRPELGAMSLDEVLHGLELFAKEVLPTVHSL